MDKTRVLSFLSLLLVGLSCLVNEVSSKGDLDGDCKRTAHTHCPSGFEQVYKQQNRQSDSSEETDEPPKPFLYCCTKGSPKVLHERKKAEGCLISNCAGLQSSSAADTERCATLPRRWIDGKRLKYEEVVKDKCAFQYEDGSPGTGVEVLCCPKNSKEGMLTLLLGAELHQFPHFALVHVNKGEHHTSVCGGTIYNERYIITASHCVLSDGVIRSTEKSKVMLDVRLSDNDNPNSYDVEEFIPHPESTRWKVNSSRLYNDVALIKLKKAIKFGPHIKALPIAKKGFDPFKYSNETVLIGIGDTDTTLRSNMLQRVRTLLRRDKINIENYWPEYSMEDADGLLFLGGIQDGVTSPRSGPGDSGGPAICRDEDGYALMCGTDSTGPDLATCEQSFTEDVCYPLAYMETQHYYEWFVSVAGDQSKAQVLKQPLFGAPVPQGQFEHQVQIRVKGGPSCGGTLIEKDLVLTAGHCVVDDDGNPKKNVRVWTGVRRLGDSGQEIEVEEVVPLQGFQKAGQGTRKRRIARLNVLPTPKYPYYKNDLALLKLKTKANISSKKLPRIGAAPLSTGDADEVVWTTEVALPLDPNGNNGGSLQQRQFKLLEPYTCQKRINRASYADYSVKIDENVMCGEEMYNGGAQCDRELGGGLFRKDKKGRDVLCGVQVFRFCQLALPSAFLDVNRYKEWIEEAKKTKLKR